MTTRPGPPPAAGAGDTVVLVPAAGAGIRMGPGAPKALRLLGGEPLLVHAVRRVAAAAPVGCVVVAAPPGQEPAYRELLDPVTVGLAPFPEPARIIIVAGGLERQHSVAAALTAAPAGFDIVLVHDAARALAPVSLVEDVAAAVRGGCDAVIPVLPVTDTVAEVDPSGEVVGTPDRSALRAVQTPQGFRRAALEAAHAAAAHAAGTAPAGAASPATDDASLVARLGVPVRTIPGSVHAVKITTQHDLVLAEALLARTPSA